MKNKSEIAVSKNLIDFIYLFLTDLVRIPLTHDYKSYTVSEPGYGACMLRAYIAAFNSPGTGQMSESLIKSIHKEAMSFMLDSNPGQYRNNHNHLTVYPYNMYKANVLEAYNPIYGLTKEGLKDFIHYWFNPMSDPVQYIVCEKKVDSIVTEGYFFCADRNGVKVHTFNANGCIIAPQRLNFEQAEKRIFELASQFEFTCVINPFYNEPQEKVQELTAKHMKKIINEFNTEIMNAHNSDEKITIIAKHIQRIDQLHPFLDGNIRTCYILLNKLLRDHGLSLSLLMNPNRLDVCSLDQVVEMIKQGQMYYQQVIQHSEGLIHISAEKEWNKQVQLFTCLPQKLFDIDKQLVNDFIACVIEEKPKLQNTVADNPFIFLSSPKNGLSANLLQELSLIINIKDKLHNQLVTAINNQQFDTVLRQVCANYTIDVIETVLKHQDKLSFNPLKKSSNGKNAFNWLEGNKHLDNGEKESVKSTLETFANGTNLEL